MISARVSCSVAHMSAQYARVSSHRGSGSGNGRPKTSPKYLDSESDWCLTRPRRLVPVVVRGRRMSYSESPSSFQSITLRISRRSLCRYSFAKSSIMGTSLPCATGSACGQRRRDNGRTLGRCLEGSVDRYVVRGEAIHGQMASRQTGVLLPLTFACNQHFDRSLHLYDVHTQAIQCCLPIRQHGVIEQHFVDDHVVTAPGQRGHSAVRAIQDAFTNGAATNGRDCLA